MYSYYMCVHKCETKAQVRERVCLCCVCCVRECVLSCVVREGGTCKRQMVTQWSCSPTPSLFLTPFWVLHLFPVTSPESYLICFFPSSPLLSIFIIASFSPSQKSLNSHLSSLTLLHFVFLQPFLSFSQLRLFCPLVGFFAEGINLKIPRDFFVIVILAPADTAHRILKRFGIQRRKPERKTQE